MLLEKNALLKTLLKYRSIYLETDIHNFWGTYSTIEILLVRMILTLFRQNNYQNKFCIMNKLHFHQLQRYLQGT